MTHMHVVYGYVRAAAGNAAAAEAVPFSNANAARPPTRIAMVQASQPMWKAVHEQQKSNVWYGTARRLSRQPLEMSCGGPAAVMYNVVYMIQYASVNNEGPACVKRMPFSACWCSHRRAR